MIKEIFFVLFLAILYIDWRWHIIHDYLLIGGVVLVAVLAFRAGSLPLTLQSLVGGVCGFASLGILYLLSFPGKLGFGDVKLAGLIGLVCGFPSVFIALGIGFIEAGIIACYLTLAHKNEELKVLPFGSFLAGGAIIALFWADDILAILV